MLFAKKYNPQINPQILQIYAMIVSDKGVIMPFTPIGPTDIKGIIDPVLIEKADTLALQSAKLTGNHSVEILDAIREHLRIINSYYSNRIESEGTHPLNIEAAMRKNFSNIPRERSLQQLSLAYMQTQRWIEEQASQTPSPYAITFIGAIHEHFYSQEGMEPFLHIEHDGNRVDMVPGELRQLDIHVANCIAPQAVDVPSLMTQFETLYSRTLGGSLGHWIVHAFASHHRLLWIHPFIDGNGRTARLALDAIFYHMKLEGYGLWNISRGLARRSDAYKSLLRRADMIRQGSLDGKGALSSMALKEFIMFMLECAEDQVAYMSRYLKLSELGARFDAFVKKSQSKELTIAPLPKGTNALFKELLIYGTIPRGRVASIIGASDRTGTTVIKELLKHGYLESDSQKGPIRLKIDTYFASHLFPELVPEAH
jgi:Fic family protein